MSQMPVHEVTRTKPSYVVIEDLNVKGMLKNRHLAHEIKSLGFSQVQTATHSNLST